MANIKPAIPKGTRDFSPADMVKRNYIFDTIKAVFKKYGYQEIQTPAMENLDTLTGKYGDEGDKLIFKILNSGEYNSSIIKQVVPKLNDVIENTQKSFILIAQDFSKSLSGYLISIKNENENLKKDELLSKRYWPKLEEEIKATHNSSLIKDAFIKYLLSKKPNFKSKSRLDYYSELESDSRLEEINKSFYNFIKRSSNIRNLISLEADFRRYTFLNSNNITPLISEKALRYDLTVPFARYVVMHQNEITFPFKRFQVQPVWRADRPQRGRYREFYQCDADVVGSDSLLNEAEFILIYDEALSNLGLTNFTVKINNRKILSGIAEIIGKSDNLMDLTVAIDKLDKIGFDGVVKELLLKGFTTADIEQLRPIILLEGSNLEKLDALRSVLKNSLTGMKGIEEIEKVFNYLNSFALKQATIEVDITLARGLNYYTGAIFEVKTNEVAMGSIGGGGRYDDLTGMFGLKNLTGAGISFGADRIYDVLEELKLFPESSNQNTQVLICCFDAEGETYALPYLQQLRQRNINAELYPVGAKMQKQMKYANDKQVPFTIVIGSSELESGLLAFKNMQSGEQQKLSFDAILTQLIT